ncbi:deaminase domain-containing protein, partial [Micromonospora sp. LOL_021]|uniref:deaminase domain-containing protein n=1 Tax=Micromonospora sp. LOL_021 TaxID=3345417 RepID=UPI003A83E6CE
SDPGVAQITATDGHPFWVPELDEWIDATDLQPGQWLQTSSGTWVQVAAIQRWTVPHATVHNLTISRVHTYHVVADATPVLVHNCGLAKIAADHRVNGNGGLGVRESKNIAVMRSQIDGQASTVGIATSGRHVNPGEVSMPSARQFTPPNPSRAYDSEVFLLEDLAIGLSPTSTGTVQLYSERIVCPSCEDVIGQFKMRFPGISIRISTGQD